MLIRALFELMNEDEDRGWDLVFVFERPDIPAITDSEENNEAIENSSSFVFSNDNPEIIVNDDNDDNAADAATNATAEVCTAGEQRDGNPGDFPATAPLRRTSGEEAEDRQCWEERWDFDSDSGNAESSSAKDSDDDNPLPGPSSKWTPRDEQSLISYLSTSSEDSEEECQSSLPWKRTRNPEEELRECPHDSFKDSNDSGDELLPGPSSKRRRDRAERDQAGKENSGK